MSGVDRAWLLMDRPSNPMMIVGLITLEVPIERSRLRELIAERFLAYPRFRCLPISNTMGGSWVEADRFDIDDHLSCHALPKPAGQSELEDLVGELASMPFRPGAPLWAFDLIENYAQGGAIVTRIHHAYADGIALVKVLLSLADATPGARRRRRKHPEAAAGAWDWASGWLPGVLKDTLREGLSLTGKAMHLATHPVETSALARKAFTLAGELAHLGLLADDPSTQLKHSLSGIRRVAWADPLSLAEIRTLSRVLGCTVNDVLISTLAGALGRYLAAHGDAVAGLSIRATLPVNLRPEAGGQLSLGNYFGLVFVDLPIGIRHPLERLYAVHAAMLKLKDSPQALVTLALLQVVGSLPASVEEPVVALFSAKASLVASNLPGPKYQLHLAGSPVAQLLFWVPQAGDIGTGVSMLSYNGGVQFGVMADRQLIPKPAELVAEIRREFERLALVVLLGAERVTA
jgi:WS/DGAT/MGAT family acyltransferase